MIYLRTYEVVVGSKKNWSTYRNINYTYMDTTNSSLNRNGYYLSVQSREDNHAWDMYIYITDVEDFRFGDCFEEISAFIGDNVETVMKHIDEFWRRTEIEKYNL